MKQRWPILLLAAAIAASTILLLYLGRGQTPVVDQWAYIYAYQPWTAEMLLTPHSGHLIVLPLVVQKAMLEVFGLESQLAFQLLNLALSAAVASMLFALIRKAVGDLLALAAATVILFYGAGADVLIPTFQITNLIGIASGLAMLLALRRESLWGDVGACLFLAMSLASFSIGVAFAAGAALALALRPPGLRLSRCWVVLAPIVIYGAWVLWARKFDEQTIYVHNLKILGSALFDQLGAALSGLTGLFTTPNGPKPDANPVPIRTTWAPALVVGLAALLIVRFRRPPRPSPNALVAVTVLVVYFLLVAIALNQFRNTFDTRLVYLGSILTLLAVAELGGPYRPSRTVLCVVGVVFVFSMSANIAELSDSAQFWRGQAAMIRAKLAAVKIAGEAGSPPVLVEDPPGAMTFNVETALQLEDDFGLPAYSEAELKTASPGDRQIADEELVRVLAITPRPGGPLGPAAGGAEVVVGAISSGKAVQRGSCVVLSPAGGKAEAILRLPPGGITYASTGPVDVSLGRFADTLTVSLPQRSGTTTVPIPADGSGVPWHAGIAASARTTVCPSAEPV
ncbi:MAG TPA: hypothetical protein VFT10_01035 [Solirubrobacterales bacterium]|nr:hypothetical protein [Solirubrobacterales bacterium]